MRRPLVRDRIGAEVRSRIARGFYAPGAAMPTERELAREFSASQRDVSRALMELQRSGLIDRAPGRGTRVLAMAERTGQGAVAIMIPVTNPPKMHNLLAMQGMQRGLGQAQQHFVLVPADNPESFAAEDVTARHSGVLCFDSIGMDTLILELERRRFPCVVPNLEKSLEVSGTWVDHCKTTQTAVRMLAAMGHRRMALLIRPPDQYFYGKALKGYQDGLNDAGIAFDESQVAICQETDAVSAYVCMRDYLRSRPAPTGLVAARDYLANGACQALTEMGFEIGRDVSVIGFDDTSWPQEQPFLTTFAEPSFELGRMAAEMLVERLIHGWRPPERREIHAPLILRKSAGPCLRDGGASFPLTLSAHPMEPAARP